MRPSKIEDCSKIEDWGNEMPGESEHRNVVELENNIVQETDFGFFEDLIERPISDHSAEFAEQIRQVSVEGVEYLLPRRFLDSSSNSDSSSNGSRPSPQHSREQNNQQTLRQRADAEVPFTVPEARAVVGTSVLNVSSDNPSILVEYERNNSSEDITALDSLLSLRTLSVKSLVDHPTEN